ncbi:MAG: NAD(P)-binding domain-containing protein [Planctomycetales bacterium]|nr:NAD(P)-binding domain-containing protein [Planctomycetales bacterium]
MTRQVDYLIIGGGPAGLQLAYLLQRDGRDCLTLESADRVGTFFELYPRHRKLLSINKRYTGYDDAEGKLRYDWNSLLCDDEQMSFTKYSEEYFADARDYARYLRDYAARFNLKIQFNTRVCRIEPLGGNGENGYRVLTECGQSLECRCLVVATGVWKPFLPDIPGIELTENYMDCSLDPDDFANQKVLIIGKGNSAFETANHLGHVTRVTHLCSPSPIKFAWQTHFFGHLRAVNNDFLDTYILKGQNSVLDAEIERIERDDDELVVTLRFSHAEGQRAVMAYDRVICCAGFRWDYSLFGGGCEPDLACECRLPAMTSGWESENLPNLFYAGTIMQIRDLKKTMSNVLHGFRFNVLCLSRIVQQRVDPNYEWPCERLPMDAEALADKLIRRVSTNAGLMHQPGFLCDVIVVDHKRQEVRYYDILPVEYVADSAFSENEQYYVVTMEYGEFKEDPFAEHREPDAAKAYQDAYLHPRLRRYSRGEYVDEHHISESLENDWRLDEHLGAKPLIRQMHFIGQADATQFQHTHRCELLKYLQAGLGIEDCSADSEVLPAHRSQG